MKTMTSEGAMSHTIHTGDCRDVLRAIDAESLDACVTDPPYGLSFMGKGWDRGVPGVEFWAEVLRVIKPGAHVLTFGGSRTFHRLACAIEDAGFEIRDTLSWLYGSGFPKSHNLPGGLGTALKPGWEPIILARKPFRGTVARNVEEHGTGALNIDGCRVPAPGESTQRANTAPRGWSGGWSSDDGRGYTTGFDNGRWPANVLHDGCLDAEPWGRFFYSAKASRADRDAGLDALPVLTPGEGSDRTEGSEGITAYAGATGPARNPHPTVKPTELMRWCCRLITPPGGGVLDPFCGSGSTGRGAVLEGFGFVGIELDPAYAEIARLRVADAATQHIEVEPQLTLDGVGR